jgi:predicted ATP-grasp superfamily ATP-dependent carboligase
MLDESMSYLGGQLPLNDDLALRANVVGYSAIEGIDGFLGYIGVDLILGEAPDGSQDYAIEINPRLTTSYVGLRALADFNLAQAMIDVVEGRPVDYIKWKPGRVQFWPDGRLDYDPTPGAFYE